MWRERTPDLRTRSRLHQLPVTVLSSKGRNHTPGAWGTHTRSSVGIASTAISAWMPGCCTIIAIPSHAGCGWASIRQPERSERFELDAVLAQLFLDQVLPRPPWRPDLRDRFVSTVRLFLRDDGAVQEDHRRRAQIDLAMHEHLARAERFHEGGKGLEVPLGRLLEVDRNVHENEPLARDDERLIAHCIVYGRWREIDHRFESLLLQTRERLGGWLPGSGQAGRNLHQ